MSWRTRWATGARECTHGQLAVVAAVPALAAGSAAATAEPARVSATATAAPYRTVPCRMAPYRMVVPCRTVPCRILPGLARRVRVPGVRCQARTMTPPALGCRRGWRRWSHSDPEDRIRQYLTQ